MKLDTRIIEGKKPLTCFDVEIAKQFIDKDGYFAHGIDGFCNLNNVVCGQLSDVDNSSHIPFDCTDTVGDNYYYSFFLPKEWVVKKEPQWRPYTLQEFIDNVGGVGDVVTYRFHDKSGTSKCEWTSLIVEIETCQNGESETFPIKIWIGESEFLLKELFEHYEYRKNGQWQPFGVKE